MIKLGLSGSFTPPMLRTPALLPRPRLSRCRLTQRPKQRQRQRHRQRQRQRPPPPTLKAQKTARAARAICVASSCMGRLCQMWTTSCTARSVASLCRFPAALLLFSLHAGPSFCGWSPVAPFRVHNATALILNVLSCPGCSRGHPHWRLLSPARIWLCRGDLALPAIVAFQCLVSSFSAVLCHPSIECIVSCLRVFLTICRVWP